MKTVKNVCATLLCLLSIIPARSQQLPNADLDSLCICAIDRVWQWVTSDVYYIQQDTVQNFTPNTLYHNSNSELHFAMNTVQLNYDEMDSSGAIGSVKLFTRSDMVFQDGSVFKGFIFNGEHFYTDANGQIDLARCGTPFTFRPDSISIRYKFEDTLSSINETGKVQVLLKKFNSISHSIDTIAFAESNSELSPTLQWTRIAIPLHYISSNTPDSVVVALFSSSGNGKPTTLWIDHINFVYASSGLNEPTVKSCKQVFPNPAHDFIYFNADIGKHSSFKIYDIRGNLVQSGITSPIIDIQYLNQGYYLMRVDDNELPGITVTFVKQ